MNPAIVMAVALLAGGVDLPTSGGKPVVARDSDAFRSASRSLSVDEAARFWNLIRHGTGGWLDSKQFSEVRSLATESASQDRVLLLTGRPNTYLLVAEASKGPAGVLLSYSATWEDSVKSIARSGEWWDQVAASVSVLESSRTDCTPRLGSKDNAVVYIQVSRPGRAFEVVTYGLPPASPAGASAGSDLGSCGRSLLNLKRLLEGPAISSLDASSSQSRPGGS